MKRHPHFYHHQAHRAPASTRQKVIWIAVLLPLIVLALACAFARKYLKQASRLLAPKAGRRDVP